VVPTNLLTSLLSEYSNPVPARMNVASKNLLLATVASECQVAIQLVSKFSAAYLSRIKFRRDNKNPSVLPIWTPSSVSYPSRTFLAYIWERPCKTQVSGRVIISRHLRLSGWSFSMGSIWPTNI